jgi:hypothetical protein
MDTRFEEAEARRVEASRQFCPDQLAISRAATAAWRAKQGDDRRAAAEAVRMADHLAAVARKAQRQSNEEARREALHLAAVAREAQRQVDRDARRAQRQVDRDARRAQRQADRDARRAQRKIDRENHRKAVADVKAFIRAEEKAAARRENLEWQKASKELARRRGQTKRRLDNPRAGE